MTLQDFNSYGRYRNDSSSLVRVGFHFHTSDSYLAEFSQCYTGQKSKTWESLGTLPLHILYISHHITISIQVDLIWSPWTRPRRRCQNKPYQQRGSDVCAEKAHNHPIDHSGAVLRRRKCSGGTLKPKFSTGESHRCDVVIQNDSHVDVMCLQYHASIYIIHHHTISTIQLLFFRHL